MRIGKPQRINIPKKKPARREIEEPIPVEIPERVKVPVPVRRENG